MTKTHRIRLDAARRIVAVLKDKGMVAEAEVVSALIRSGDQSLRMNAQIAEEARNARAEAKRLSGSDLTGTMAGVVRRYVAGADTPEETLAREIEAVTALAEMLGKQIAMAAAGKGSAIESLSTGAENFIAAAAAEFAPLAAMMAESRKRRSEREKRQN